MANLWDLVCAKLSRPEGYARLSADEKLWVNVRGLIDLTNDRGIAAYFQSAHADHLEDCIAALEELDAGPVREYLGQVAALFEGPVPDNADARKALLQAWNEENGHAQSVLDAADAALCVLFDDLEERLQAFLEESGLARPQSRV